MLRRMRAEKGAARPAMTERRKPEPLGPTPERLRQAEGLVQPGQDGSRIVRDAPIERLHEDWKRGRQGLDIRLYSAATKFRHHWHHAGMTEKFSSMNLSGVFGSGNPAHAMPASEAVAHHREQYRNAVQDIGVGGSAIVESIVCRELPLNLAGAKYLGYANDAQARAAATAALRIHLDRLATLWGIS